MSSQFDTESDQPDDTSCDDVRLAEWAAQIADRVRAGEPVDLNELAREQPEDVEVIRQLLPAISLMAELGSGGGSNQTPESRVFSDPGPADELGTLGDFQLLRAVGRGGMGVVYEARQISLRRRVAIKVLPFAAAIDPRQLQRFRVEAQAAALLHHPQIVPVFAVGQERGIHYYAMQFIDGRTVAEVIRELRSSSVPKGESAARASTTGVLPAGSPARTHAHVLTIASLGRQAASALGYAHAQGVLHRDVKPGNLMLDTRGHLWVTDFGLARFRDDPGVTMTGDVLGTLRYMSPEQALARPVVIDQRTDVYSLGATLYELAALRPAFDGSDRAEVLRRIAQDEPEPLRRINPAVPVDLETIVYKAIEKDLDARYATAGELADDLDRFLRGESILARRPSVGDRILKWTARHRALAGTTAALLMLMAALIVSGLSWSNARLGRYIVRLKSEVARADASAADAERSRQLAERRQSLADRHAFAARVRLAQQTLNSGQFERTQELLDEARRGLGSDMPTDFSWSYLWRHARHDVALFFEHQAPVSSVALAPNGKLLATGDGAGVVCFWDFPAGRLLAKQPAHSHPVQNLRFSADSRWLLSTARENDPDDHLGCEVLVWDAFAGRCIARLGDFERRWVDDIEFLAGSPTFGVVSWGRPEVEASYRRYAIVPDGSRVDEVLRTETYGQGAVARHGRLAVIMRPDRRLALIDASDGKAQWTDPEPAAISSRITLSNNAHWFACVDHDALTIRDTATGRILVHDTDARADQVRDLGWSPVGAQLAQIDRSGRVLLRDVTPTSPLPAPRVIRPAGLDRPNSTNAAFSPDGTRLALTHFELPENRPPMSIWDVASGRMIASYPGRHREVFLAMFAPDGHSVVSLAGNNVLHWFFEGPRTNAPEALAGHADEAWTVAFAPGDRLLATGGDDTDEPKTIKLWDTGTGQLVAGWKGHEATVTSLAFHPDGAVLASASLDASAPIKLWDVTSRRLLRTLHGHAGRARSVTFSPDGRTLVSGHDDKTIRLWDCATGGELTVLHGNRDIVNQILFQPGTQVFASAGNHGTVRLWDLTSGQALRTFRGPAKLSGLAFSPDGSHLAAADEQGSVTVFESRDGTIVQRFLSEDDSLRCLAIAPDGLTLAAAGNKGVIRLWDLVSGQESLTLAGHSAPVNSLAFSPDGSSLASCSHDGAVRLWRAGSR